MGEKTEKIKAIIERALKRMHPDLLAKYYRDGIDGYLEEVLEEYEKGNIGTEALYYIILGVAYDYMIPLSPRDVKEIREVLGIVF